MNSGDAKGASEVPRQKRTTVKPVNLSSLEPDGSKMFFLGKHDEMLLHYDHEQ